MTTKKVTAIIPCRKGSQRIANKNTRPFGAYQHGLLALKLQQLAVAETIDEILVTSNDPVVISYVLSVQKSLGKPVLLDRRPDRYATDDSLHSLVGYLSRLIQTDTVAWTHVTSPLFTAALYDEAMNAYKKAVNNQEADSLMTVDAVQTFAIRSGQWISHDPQAKRWPRTQDLEEIFLLNNALFVIDLALMQECQDRVGHLPMLFETPAPYGFDIDWEDDFVLGEKLLMALSNGESGQQCLPDKANADIYNACANAFSESIDLAKVIRGSMCSTLAFSAEH